jgi:hypothetical protein
MKKIQILAIIASFALVMTAFVKSAYAEIWDYSAAANSRCENGTVAIWIRFTNAEILNSGYTFHVFATDEQSGVSVDMGDIIAKDTVDNTIYTNVATNMNGREREGNM